MRWEVTESVTSEGRQVFIPIKTLDAVRDFPHPVNPKGKTFRFWKDAALRYQKESEELTHVVISRFGIQLSFVEKQNGNTESMEA